MNYDKLKSLDISKARKKLGYWWNISGQSVGPITAIYSFIRPGTGKIILITHYNIVQKVEKYLIPRI